MPRSKSVQKRERQNEKRRQRNQSVRSELKTYRRRATDATASGDAAEGLRALQRKVDKAATKGVIHPNKAARLKSRAAKSAGSA